MKPVNFLSTTCTNLTWKEKTKKAYDKVSGTMVSMKLLLTNIQDEYNQSMNHVDRADQLRGSYQADKWKWNRKWWWSIWMWGIETLLVNAYVLYRETHLLMWKAKKSHLTSHYDFRWAITKAWLTGSDSIEEIIQGKKRKRDSIVRTLLEPINPTNKKACHVNDAALDPKQGSLQWCLNDDYCHFPEVSGLKRTCCALCPFAQPNKNIKTTRTLANVISAKYRLCNRCFKPFHTISSIKQLKYHVMGCLAGEKRWKISKIAAAEKMWWSVKRYAFLVTLKYK